MCYRSFQSPRKSLTDSDKDDDKRLARERTPENQLHMDLQLSESESDSNSDSSSDNTSNSSEKRRDPPTSSPKKTSDVVEEIDTLIGKEKNEDTDPGKVNSLLDQLSDQVASVKSEIQQLLETGNT